MEVYEAVVRRRSIRMFQDRPVPYSDLEKCVDAGRLAPSARNCQLCEYIIVDDEHLLPAVFDSIASWGGPGSPKVISKAPKAYIITLINKTLEAESGITRSIAICDVGLAGENIMLVALEQGIGTCPVLAFREDELKRLLNIPDKYDVALLVALGYPDESPVMEVATGPIRPTVDSQGVRHVLKRKLEDIVHRNRFP